MPQWYVLNKEVERKVIEQPSDWLILDPHPDFPGQWIVNSLDPGFQYDLQEVIGSYRVVSPSKLQEFLEAADQYNYSVVFGNPPESILDAYEHLNDPIPVKINSGRKNVDDHGFYWWQVQGFNKLKDQYAAIARWDTGTGKTILATALTQYYLEKDDFDICWYVVKGDNKTDIQRAYKKLLGIDAYVIDGTPKKRIAIYNELKQAPRGTVAITNYEKYKVDFEYMMEFYDGTEIFNIWDEITSKLKNRKSQLYRAIAQCLYGSATDKKTLLRLDALRPAKIRQIMMTATPIKQQPSDFFNCVRLMDPTVLGTVSEFHREYVLAYSIFNPWEPAEWHKLEKIGLKVNHMMHQVDKSNPEVRKYFPKKDDRVILLDWDPSDRSIYEIFTEEIKRRKRKEESESEFDDQEMFALIGAMQMLCDCPSMIYASAEHRMLYEEEMKKFEELDLTAEWPWSLKPPTPHGSEAALKLLLSLIERKSNLKLVDSRHTKIKRLKEDLTENFVDDKVIVFTVYGLLLLPKLSEYLTNWGINHVVYYGTAKQKQGAVDQFRNDPNIQVFLASDAAAEAIDLPQANVSINYDMPWDWYTIRQREDRKDRVVSQHESTTTLTYQMANSVEDRRMQIIGRKLGYHDAVFRGIINEEALSSRITKEDLYWILTGEN